MAPSALTWCPWRSPIRQAGPPSPWRQHAALLAPVPAAVLLGLLRHVHGLSTEGRFSELSINRAIEWRLNNVESQLHCHLRPVASVIVSLAAAHYYYPFITGLGSASLMTRVFIGTRVVFIWSHVGRVRDTRCVGIWRSLVLSNGFHGTRYTRPGGAPGGRPRSGHAALNTRHHAVLFGGAPRGRIFNGGNVSSIRSIP